MASSAGTSTSAVVTTLVANLILFGIFITCFLVLRLKFRRIYSPKSSFDLVPEDKKPEPLPKDPIRWIFILLTKPHSFIIQQAGIDGYFFLRYLLVLAFTFLFGVATYVVLLPVNIVGGRDKPGFDKLSISNIQDSHRYYAHAFISWIFYGGFIFIIYRELFFFNSLREAALSSPKYSKKLSSRTVLFQNVPDELLDEKQFFKMFNGVKRIYVSRTNRKLDFKVNKRQALCDELERAENTLLKLAVKEQNKKIKKQAKLNKESIEDASAAIAADGYSKDILDYVPAKKIPKRKIGGMFSKKENTIDYCMREIPILDKEITVLQKRHKVISRPKNSIFVEFEDQYSAQLAYSSTSHHNPYRMQANGIGIEPSDVIWNNMRIFWWEKITRRFLACAAIVALIILWAVPVAFVGTISNITYLIQKLPWLSFINGCPEWLRGTITGLLPTILLSLLMAFLPIIIRGMAQVSGSPSKQHIELYTQQAYFGFLILNSFLITTLASSATSTITEIIDKPTNAMSILAAQLPTSSNFYISYLILQGLSIAGASLFQVVPLFLYYILGFLLDNTVRKKWARFTGLGSMSWGTTFPVYTNLACITLAYSIISPLILIFAACAFLLCYIAFCHNITYCFIEGPDSRGMHYPRALFQTFTGLYLGQVCLLGLFIVGKGWGPIVIQAIGIGCTVFAHIHLNEAFDHLLSVVPIDCMRPLDGVSKTCSFVGQSDYREKVLNKHHRHRRNSKLAEEAIYEDQLVQQEVKHELLSPDYEVNDDENTSTIVPLMADRDHKSTASQFFLVKFLRPDVYLNFRHVKKMLPATYNIEPEITDNKHAYDPPVVSTQLPKLWIPRDPMGLSTVEISKLSSVIEVSDENATFNEKGRIIYLGPPK